MHQAIPERCVISCNDLGSYIPGSGMVTPGCCTLHITSAGCCPSLWYNPNTNTAAELLTVHSPDSPSLCLSTGLQKHLNNSLQAEVSYKMCQGRVAVLYGQAVWGTRPREVTALYNSEAVKQLTQIAVLTLVLLTLVLPLKLILLLSRASQEKHPKL